MRVSTVPGQPIEGFLLYRLDDHAFDFVLGGSTEADEVIGLLGTTSLLVGTLQIEVDIETGRLLYVWGYSPKAGWRVQQDVWVPHADPAVARVLDVELEPGISLTVAEAHETECVYDPPSGVVRAQAADASPDAAIRIAAGVDLLLEKGALVGVVLHPHFDDGSS